MTLKEYDKKTEEIISERECNRKKIEREIINANILRRDQFRLAKQKWEDDGNSGVYTTEKGEAIQAFIEAAKTEAIIKKKRKELKRMEKEEAKEKLIAEEAEMKRVAEELAKEETRLKKIAKLEEAKKQARLAADRVIEEAKRVAELKTKAEEKAEEVKEAIDEYQEAKITLDEEQRAIKFEEENPGKRAIWNGKFTQAFLQWEKEGE